MNIKSIIFLLICGVFTQVTKAFHARAIPIIESRISKAMENSGCGTALGGWCGVGEFYTPRSLLSPDQIVKMFDEFEKDLTSSGSSFSTINSWGNTNMPMDIKETKESYKFYIDLPGIEKKDIDIKIKGNELSITAKRDAIKKEDESEKLFRLERKVGSYQRTITLPDDVDRKAITAENKNGVLELTIMKLPDSIEKELTIEVN